MTPPVPQADDGARRAQQVAWIRAIALGGRAMGDALRKLAHAYDRNMIWMCMQRFGLTAAEAEEVWQDVLVNICRHAADFDPNADPAPWIVTLVKNRATDELRGGYRRRRADHDDTPRPDDAVPPAHEQTPRLAVDRCVQLGLRDFAREFPDEADVIVLRDLEDWSIPQVAAFLSRTETATRAYLSSLRKKLRPFLAPCLELLATAEI